MSSMDYEDDYMDETGDDDASDGMENGDEEDSDDGEDDYGAGDGFAPVVADRDVKKPYEVDYKVHSADEIIAFQMQEVGHVAGIIGCLPEHAATLLRTFKWNKERLIERYMEDPEGESERAGVVMDAQKQPRFVVVKGFECPICCMDDDDLETIALQCGHRFCRNCYAAYLSEKVFQQGESRRIQCMESGCKLVVDERTVELVVPQEMFDKYRTLLLRTYVDDSPHLKWCPAPDCVYAIECHVTQLLEVVPTVQCKCQHVFCFGCGLRDHQPCICMLVKFWLKKCADDSETANWISANTKECTKCGSTIEKNGGCNHMTCKKCKHEFCWVCLGPWSDHGTAWYSCNRFDEKASLDARDSQAKSRQALERYLHYYNRYANHEQSAKLSSDLLEKTAIKMEALQSTSTLSWIEVQFLRKACDVLLESRMTLKWTYSFAYFLKRDNATALFEDNQRDLEMAVENLNELLERPIAGVDLHVVDRQNHHQNHHNGISSKPTSSTNVLAVGTPPSSSPASAAVTPQPSSTSLAAVSAALEDSIRDLRQQVLDKMGYVKTRREVLLNDTAQGLKERRWLMNVDHKTGLLLD
ncbi:hypothetical protein HKX48_000470 [Thoreauomyces humboldtii]|nr:hypothetical protein HKX48_000470 [Thoreauomyces humboldtii]